MEKLKSIYFLRGVAAVAVVLQHSFVHDGTLAPGPFLLDLVYDITNYGYLGVALFFIISGFCIHLRTAKNIRLKGRVELDWRDFWWRRVYRLYPPYIGMLLISMALWAYVWSMGGANIYPGTGGEWLVLDLVSHLFMLHGLHPALDQGAGNPAYWTLAREEYLYLMYAAILIGLRRFYGMWKAVGVVLVLGIVSYLASNALVSVDSPWHRLVILSPVYLWIQWALGALAVEAYFGIVKLPRWCYWLPLVPIWLGVGYLSREYFTVIEPAAWGMAFFTLLNYCVRREGEGRWPDSFPFRWLFAAGVFSYSMYLAHPVVVAVIWRLLDMKDIKGRTASLLVSCLAIVCCIVAGKVYYTLVERHFLNTKPTMAAPKVEPLTVA